MSSTDGREIGSDLVSTMHWALHTEAKFGRHAREVWPVFRDIRSWYTEYTFDVISGPPYQAGVGLVEDQVMKVTSSKGLPRTSGSTAAGAPEFFIHKTIKVDPPMEIVVLLSGSAYDFKQYTSFYVWKVMESDNDTTILVNTYGEAELIERLPTREFLAYREEIASNWRRSWSEAFVSLKKALQIG